MQTFHALSGKGIYCVEAVTVKCGVDLSINIAGGEAYHIGASALAVPRPSLSDKNKISASASVLCAVGHKEDQLARQASLRFASLFNCRVNVTVGLHIDQATAQDIEQLESNCENVLKQTQEMLIAANLMTLKH